jgi:hypothetical protein
LSAPLARRLAAALVLAAGLAVRAQAMDVLPLGLEEVVDRAGDVVHGTVVEVAPGRDADGVAATWVTVAVAESLKGGARDRLTFKQVGTSEPLGDGAIFRVPGLPRYRVGDELVLFLHPPSARGFTSPVGLGQGVVRVEAQSGERFVRSLRVPPDKEPLPAFLERVRRRAGR